MKKLNLSSYSRAASSLLLVVILAAVAAIALFTFFSTVRQERSRTGRLVLKARGQYLARRVVMKIAAVVQEKPWSDRFFQEKAVPFYSSEGPFKDTSADLGPARYEGTVRQISSQNKRYRVKLRVTFSSGSVTIADTTFASAWDLMYSEGILGNLNRTHVLAMAESDSPDTPDDQLDQQLDMIRNEARKPDKDGVDGDSSSWMADVGQLDGNAEALQAGLFSQNLGDLQVPSWVDGQGSQEPLDPIAQSVKTAVAGVSVQGGAVQVAVVRPPPSGPRPAAGRSPAVARQASPAPAKATPSSQPSGQPVSPPPSPPASSPSTSIPPPSSPAAPTPSAGSSPTPAAFAAAFNDSIGQIKALHPQWSAMNTVSVR